MNKKVLILSAVMASLLFDTHEHAGDTRIGVTIYNCDDNFMSIVCKTIEKDGESAPDVQLLTNDSRNDQSKQNDQIDVLLAKGVKELDSYDKAYYIGTDSKESCVIQGDLIANQG